MKDLFLPTVEFYITNVCNLSCAGCNRFNNYKFKGLQRWDDYKDIYRRWSEELHVTKYIGILGGEPMLNPDFMNWLEGISLLWPWTKINVITNGYRINQVRGLYDFLNANKRVTLKVGIHNKKSKQYIFDILKTFLKAPLTFNFNNDDIYNEYMYVTDANNVRVLVEYNWWFHQGSLINQDDQFTLYQSDPIKAHNNCSMKYCYTFIRGKLYKCGVAALLPEFDEQYPIILSESDRQLMTSYSGLDIDSSIEYKRTFINNLPNYIDQCKFCPETYKGDQIFAEEKKIAFVK